MFRSHQNTKNKKLTENSAYASEIVMEHSHYLLPMGKISFEVEEAESLKVFRQRFAVESGSKKVPKHASGIYNNRFLWDGWSPK